MNSEAEERYRRTGSNWIRRVYVRWILPYVSDPLVRQRLKLCYFAWGYSRLLFMNGISLVDRWRLVSRFLRVDWAVLHGHLPSEIVHVAATLTERRALPGEAMVEAGCWQGGSSAKFSVLCALFGYRLCIYDSFEGVERLSAEEQAQEWDYAGQYASPESRLRDHLERYGEPDVCTIVKGWFSETLAVAPVPYRVRIAFIDCDLGKATVEALQGIVPSLADDGRIFSQDFHIEPVRRVLFDSQTWEALGTSVPSIRPLGVHLASIRFDAPRSAPPRSGLS